MSRQRFLWELGVEEIPSRYLDEIHQALWALVEEALKRHRLDAGPLQGGATPRRLVLAGEVASRQRPERQRVRGPQWKAAFTPDGEPTPALRGFLGRVGVAVEAVEREEQGGREYAVVEVARPEEPAAAVLPQALAEAYAALSLPRSMRWGAGNERFIRPIRWNLLLLDDALIPWTVAGVESRAMTYGNRTDHPEPVAVESIDHYWRLLPQIRVMLSGEERRRTIQREATRLAGEVGGVVGEHPALLDEVANLVEWPTPFLGAFDPAFLEVPEPVLITSMRVHQRYFPVLRPDGALLPYFIGVRNGIGESLDAVRHGNEKVLRARLNDASYFYREDLKHSLAERAQGLDRVLFWEGLGSYRDKVERLKRLGRRLAEPAGLDAAEAQALERAIELAKADLLTHVVQEFPELEGTMGGIYAQHNGEAPVVSQAIAQHYLPRGQGDPIPEHRVGQLLALLDRADTLVAFLGHEIRPTGSEDPYGLRRAGLGIARILSEGDLPALGVRQVLEAARDALGVSETAVAEAWELVIGRLAGYWAERWPEAWVRALTARSDRLGTLRARLEQLSALAQDPQWEEWLTAYKRVARVLAGWRRSGPLPPPQGEAEVQLYAAASQVLASFAPEAEAWPRWWASLPELLAAVRQFFDAVLVLDPDPAVRERRMALADFAREALSAPLEPESL
ncbi:MAG: glycine--tRNA ligase subunit beta [Firmicutes bacterium]|nr:glycine--tRNA ligase subunit beta [Bacillota bacterium]